MSVTPETIVIANAQEMARTGARMVSRAARVAVCDRGRFVMALSGGSTPRAMNRLLAERRHREKIPWPSTDIFMVDERMVDLTHPHSNFGNARNDLLDHLPISPDRLHPMPVTGSLEEMGR
jgi:6-phosphogluconolactonase